MLTEGKTKRNDKNNEQEEDPRKNDYHYVLELEATSTGDPGHDYGASTDEVNKADTNVKKDKQDITHKKKDKQHKKDKNGKKNNKGKKGKRDKTDTKKIRHKNEEKGKKENKEHKKKKGKKEDKEDKGRHRNEKLFQLWHCPNYLKKTPPNSGNFTDFVRPS